MRWKYTFEKGEVGEVAIIAKNCFRGAIHRCDKQGCQCKEVSVKHQSCCIYEYLGRARLGGGGRNEDIWASPKVSDPDCTSWGWWDYYGEVRAFRSVEEILEEIKHDPWKKPATISCGGIPIGVGIHIPNPEKDKPKDWDSQELLDATGWQQVKIDWDCCPGDEQYGFYQSSSAYQDFDCK